MHERLAAESAHDRGRTGGFAVVNTNAPGAGVDRMLAENGSYYLIGYNSPARPNDGKHHRITVRTRVRMGRCGPGRL